ncbi:MAG: sensor histidine kinase [Ferruginibacter sp.]|nr:sensor histidine kinase [Ferruginibacter sp.]
MQLKHIFPKFLKDNIYLLLIAAWLITLSFIIDKYWSATSNLSTAQKQMNAYLHKAESDFDKTLEDSASLAAWAGGHYDEEALTNFTKKNYFIFQYLPDSSGQPTLKTWNTQTIIPAAAILYDTGTVGFIQLPNGYYVWKKAQQANRLVLALIPVRWNYIVTNEYLQNDFVNDPSISVNYTVSLRGTAAGKISSLSGKPLFFLEQNASTPIFKNNSFSVALRIIAALLVLLFVHLFASFLAVHKKFFVGAGFLFASIFLLRVLSYYLPVPLNFRQFELFDPAIYGSSLILRSLGDLLINAILFLWFVTFVRYHLHFKNISIVTKKPFEKWVWLGAGCLVILLSTFTGSVIIRSLVADSQISFDVINFFSLSIYSVIGFIVLCCVAIGYYFLCEALLFLLKPLFPRPFIALFGTISVLALFLLSFRIGEIKGGFELYVLAWLLLFLFLLNYDRLNLLASRVITSKMVFWLFFFSISISSVIIMENNRKELRNRQHYAEILATKSDPASETLLNSMLTDFRSDFLANNFYRFRNEAGNRFFKDSLVNNNFSRYTDKYDTHVMSFDANEQPLYNTEATDYNQLNTILNTQAKATGIPNLYYYDEAYDRFSYITKKTIVDTAQQLIGYIFIVVNPKNSQKETLYLEVFSKGHNNAIENSSTYAFAIYSNGKLISSHNDYPFATKLPDRYFANQQYLLINKNDHNEMWYNAGNNKYVVIVKENSWSIESITLFSYLFCAFLLLTALFWLINMILKSRLNPDKLKAYWQLSIRNQVHGTIIFFSTVSFLVIGVATILFFISRYENNNREKLSSTIRIMEKELKESVSQGWLMNDSLEIRDQASQQTIEQTINKISEIHGVDVNLYTLNGDLKVSSLPLPYIKGIVSKKMDPMAFYHLSDQKEVQYFQKEKIGKLSFLSNYVPVIDANGNEFAFLNIPYFTSQSKLKQEISNFLVTIINLNAFIFLIAGIVALFITNRITRSFSLISEKMKRINLDKRNEAIVWTRNDEIGDLVIEYNKMVAKLEESAAALAKTEREGAWREMARQVAHEIKNPLTPMKLSMQYLQKSIQGNAPNVKELSERVANTLVEQIDHLSRIASEFSQFANIGNANKEVMDINETLRSLADLYDHQNSKLSWQLLEEPVYISADKTHINRLFTNLIQNALQAVSEGMTPEILITEELIDNTVLVKLRDNGTGIDEHIQTKIFTPNFTTKTSGTGLGLAMCKRIVEQSNGSIHFETSPSGTTFFINFPLAET